MSFSTELARLCKKYNLTHSQVQREVNRLGDKKAYAKLSKRIKSIKNTIKNCEREISLIKNTHKKDGKLSDHYSKMVWHLAEVMEHNRREYRSLKPLAQVSSASNKRVKAEADGKTA